ncbi:MAG: terpene cyclase/mutase family protein [Planctomycetes bacterium]|nr:terpene cyclase/mutase family protein [Planctomycetota bacterium]
MAVPRDAGERSRFSRRRWIGLTFVISFQIFFWTLLLVDPLAGGAPARPRPDPRGAGFVEQPLVAVAHDAPPERLLEKALLWLVRHQYEEGSWDAQAFWQRCRNDGFVCLHKGSSQHNVGVSALATLALLESGWAAPASAHPQAEAFREAGLKGLGWLTRQMDGEGCVGPRRGKFMYGHAIATAALSRAYTVFADEPLWRHWAARALRFLLNARCPNGGWGYGLRSGEADTSVTGWAAAAILAARQALVRADVPQPGVDAGLRAWVDAMTDPDTHAVGYVRPGRGSCLPGVNDRYQHKESTTASGLFIRRVVGQDPRHPHIAGGITLLCSDLPYWSQGSETVDFCYWYFGSRALLDLEGPQSERWHIWAAGVLRALARHQRPFCEGCGEGSWKPVDRWGFEGGRVYATALNALNLATVARGMPKPEDRSQEPEARSQEPE